MLQDDENYAKKLNLSWTESYSEVYSMDLYYLNKEDHRKLKELQKRLTLFLPCAILYL